MIFFNELKKQNNQMGDKNFMKFPDEFDEKYFNKHICCFYCYISKL